MWLDLSFQYRNDRCLLIRLHTHGLCAISLYGPKRRSSLFYLTGWRKANLKCYIFMDFRSCLQHGHFWVATISYQMVAISLTWLNTHSSINVRWHTSGYAYTVLWTSLVKNLMNKNDFYKFLFLCSISSPIHISLEFQLLLNRNLLYWRMFILYTKACRLFNQLILFYQRCGRLSYI